MSRRYLIVIENNKMFVAWWVNPLNIDIILFCFLNISFLCLESYYFFLYIYNMFIWGFILNKTFYIFLLQCRTSFVEILLCLTDGNVICESYVV